MKWREVGEDVFVLEYQAKGYARTNCCAFGTADGYLILSPASNVDNSHLEFLEQRKPIIALLAPHPGHTLGLNDWKRLRPSVPVFAAPAAIQRLEKVCKIQVRPIADLSVNDSQIKISLAPGVGDSTLLIESNKGERAVVYADELLEDLDRYPGPLLLRPLMALLGKRPGFQVNRGYVRFYVKDKVALANHILKMTASNPHIIFAHGPVRSSKTDLAKTRELLESV